MILSDKIKAIEDNIASLEIELLTSNEELAYLESLKPIHTSSLFTILGSITELVDQKVDDLDITITNEQYQVGSFNSLKVVDGVVVNIKTGYHLEVEQVEAVERYLKSLGSFDLIRITK